jgi:hypothetical protein
MARRKLAIVIAVVVLGVAGVGYFVLRQMSIAHWAALVSSQLRQIHQSALVVYNNAETRPPSVYVLIWDEYISHHHIFVHQSSRSPVDVLVGDTNLAHLLELPWDEARSFVYELPQSESEWELIGDFLLGTSVLSTAPPDLVVGVSTQCPSSPGFRVVLYGDGSAAVVTGTSWIEAQNARRAELDLKQIPSLP